MDLRRVTRVGVDERSLNRLEYVTVFVDHDTGRVIFATPGKDTGAIDRFARFLKDHGGDPIRITDFTCDFGGAFLSGIRRCFRRARITVDRFHLVQLANDAVIGVKCSMIGTEINRLKLNHMLMAKAVNLDEKRRLELSEVFDTNPDLLAAYKMKESLCNTYYMESREEAQRHLEVWADVAGRSRSHRFRAL